MHGTIADHTSAALNDFTAGFKLRLDQCNDFAGLPFKPIENHRQDEIQRDERNIMVTNSAGSGSAFNCRALVCSITTTRGFLRSDSCSSPSPTSMAYTLRAPRCSKQSVNPPVEAPTSAQIFSKGLTLNLSSAALSFSPARETNSGLASKQTLQSGKTNWEGLLAITPLTLIKPSSIAR